ncbi:hypothetical protein H4582DRAFT_2133600 [Lactarius indigo]|nr:hypothetical protein H4582DRAFT_2133600 [Lactarius indigo]
MPLLSQRLYMSCRESRQTKTVKCSISQRLPKSIVTEADLNPSDAHRKANGGHKSSQREGPIVAHSNPKLDTVAPLVLGKKVYSDDDRYRLVSDLRNYSTNKAPAAAIHIIEKCKARLAINFVREVTAIMRSRRLSLEISSASLRLSGVIVLKPVQKSVVTAAKPNMFDAHQREATEVTNPASMKIPVLDTYPDAKPDTYLLKHL